MALLEKPKKDSIKDARQDLWDIKTEIAIAEFEQGILVKSRRTTKRDEKERVSVPT